MNKPLFCIIGPSGSGKTTLTNALEKYGFKSVQSYTTRKPRFDGETGHIFISKDNFDNLNLITETVFDGNKYGVTEKLLKDADLFVVDMTGIQKLKESTTFKRPIFVVGLTVSKETAIKRMLQRGDNKDMVEQRLKNDELAFKDYLSLADETVNTEGTIKETIREFFTVYIHSEDSERKIDDEYLDFVIEHLTAGIRCLRCKQPVLNSLIDGYKYQCMNCDEDLYTIETFKGDVATPDELYKLIQNTKIFLED